MSRRSTCAWRTLVVVIAAVAALAVSPAAASIRAVVIASGFTRPVALVFDPAIPGVAYVVQQNGLVLTLVNGVVRPTPFLDLRTQVTTAANEQGLLGMAFPPDAATTGRVFVEFTNTNGDTVIARFRRTAANPLVADPATRFDLRWADGNTFIDQPAPNQNGGHLLFGPDGMLYVGLGDGGFRYDPLNLAQDRSSLLGKMLRIDVGVPDADPRGYRVPAGNPFAGIAAVRPEIWDFGLRNPWRYSFDDVGPGATGALYIGDVGQVSREEIDREPAGRGGRNYGWRAREGSIITPDPDAGATPPAFTPLTPPLFDYVHVLGSAVTGGFVYRGSQLGPGLQGRYVFGDCTSGRVWSLGLHVDAANGEAAAGDLADHTIWLGTELGCITSFARDPSGELYLTSFDFATAAGRVVALRADTTRAPAPPIGLHADVQGHGVRVGWTAGLDDGTPEAFVLEATTPWGEVVTVDTASREVVAPAIPDGRYVVRVRARNAAGVSAPTPDLAIDIGCVTPAAPGLTATVDGRVVTLGWTLPPGSTAVRVEAGYAPGASNAASFTLPATPASVAVQAPDATYYVRARAVTACGVSATSPEVTIVVPGAGGSTPGGVASLRTEVVASYPHDPEAYTQGLVLTGGRLFESTGRVGLSHVREVELATGRVLRDQAVPPPFFGEGLAITAGGLVQLTWHEGLAFRYDPDTLAAAAAPFAYTGEGWGLCGRGSELVMSDGSATLTIRDAATFAVLRRLPVTERGAPVERLNELECVGDDVYADVWLSDRIVRIDTHTGAVTASIDASALLTPDQRSSIDVFNGIAYDASDGTFLVTGKLWPTLFRVRFVPAPQ